MQRFLLAYVNLLLISGLLAAPVCATPTQYGSSGLLSLPTAQTLNEGNICVGLWTSCSTGKESDAVIVPATITLGLGTFMEAYGSYPNLVFNGDEDASGRGFADIGFKFRVYGKRSDPFRLGLDLQGRRSISENPALDGISSYVTTFLASYKKETFGLHGNVGYIFNGSPDGASYDDQVTIGGGIEYFPVNRLRTIAEVSYESEKVPGQDGPAEATVGFQYFLTPHLTLNVGAGIGLTDASPDFRLLFGLSTCQGVGTFNRPVPKLVETAAAVPADETKEPAKVAKFKTLSSLVPEVDAVPSPVSQLELPLAIQGERMTLDPANLMPRPDRSRPDALALAPMGPAETDGGSAIFSSPFQATVYRKFRFPDLTFAFDQYELSTEGKEFFSVVAEELRREGRDFVISIEGHTDSIGSDAYNEKLSYQRAVTAASYLVLRNGMDPRRIFVRGYGESRPIADNATDEGRSKNRRVELLVLIPMTNEEKFPTGSSGTK